MDAEIIKNGLSGREVRYTRNGSTYLGIFSLTCKVGSSYYAEIVPNKILKSEDKWEEIAMPPIQVVFSSHNFRVIKIDRGVVLLTPLHELIFPERRAEKSAVAAKRRSSDLGTKSMAATSGSS